MMRRSIVLVLLWLTAAAALPCDRGWTVVHDQSRLGFVASWEGIEFDGVFQKFDARISLDTTDLSDSCFDVTVDVTTVDTQSADRDEGMGEPEFFDYAQYPEARYVTTAIRSVGDGRFEADGTLTIKGVSRPLTLPFTWAESSNQARLKAEVTLRRTDFRIGEGEWATDEIIGLDVRVTVELRLEAKT